MTSSYIQIFIIVFISGREKITIRIRQDISNCFLRKQILANICFDNCPTSKCQWPECINHRQSSRFVTRYLDSQTFHNFYTKKCLFILWLCVTWIGLTVCRLRLFFFSLAASWFFLQYYDARQSACLYVLALWLLSTVDTLPPPFNKQVYMQQWFLTIV